MIVRTLNGLRILVPESRELDLFVAMLEAEGAAVLRCPLVQILDLEDRGEADAWIDRFISGAVEELVLLTGEGLRRLLGLSDRDGRRSAFLDVLKKTPTITRGPKPARVLKELGLAPTRSAPSPTSQGVLDLLEHDSLSGRKLGVQLYPGDGVRLLLAGLRERGAEVDPVVPYRYASQTETERVADAIRSMAAGGIDIIAFTSSPQVDRLLAVGREKGLAADLKEAFVHVRIAAVGPVVEDTLRNHDLSASIRPESSFHLKPLVRAIAKAWAGEGSP
jgi:uroporphyrinogen-III synthase